MPISDIAGGVGLDFYENFWQNCHPRYELRRHAMMFEVHQLEGVDPTGRMFSRDAKIDVDENGYKGFFRYEGFAIESSAYPTIDEALSDLAAKLQKKKFLDVRSRLNFREERYYAEREPWVYYQ